MAQDPRSWKSKLLPLPSRTTEQRLAEADAAREQTEEDEPEAERRPRQPRNNNRGALPESLPAARAHHHRARG